MKGIFKIMLGLVLLSSCQNIQEVPKPENLIPEAKMTNILEDLAKIEAAINLNTRDFEKRGINPTAYIFEKYKIDSVQFAQSNAYYMQNFEISKRMYQEVRSRLKQQKQALDSLIHLKDSIQNTKKKMGKKDSLTLVGQK